VRTVDFQQLVGTHVLEQYFVSIKKFQEKNRRDRKPLMKKFERDFFLPKIEKFFRQY